MASPIKYDPRRFETTAEDYAKFRLGYPEKLIQRVIELLGLKAGDAVLDLGTGTGPLAIQFARAGMMVTAVDPEPEMLAAVKNAAEVAGVKIEIRAGSSYAMPEGIGPFQLVTMGRAFHWMDRIETLKLLEAMVVPGGAVVLFDDRTLKTAENRWRLVLDEVADRFGADRMPHRLARKNPNNRNHESILLGSAFANLETVGIVVVRELAVEDILGFARSLSVTSRKTLGERFPEFESALRGELLLLNPEGKYQEISELRALIARRSPPTV